MPHVTADRILEQSSTSGTGAFTLAGAVAGFRSFAEVLSIGDTCDYTIEVPSGAWEVGIGTYSAANILTRTSVQASSAGGAVVDFDSGVKRVMLGATAASFNAKAPLASPAFTGAPTAPTPAIGDSSTKLATTAFSWAMLGGIDVRRYGALLNGVADDRAAIQAAIDANPGECIVIPKPARISGPVVVRSHNTSLVGMGSAISTLTNIGSGTDAILFEPPEGEALLNKCSLKGLSIERYDGATAGEALRLRRCNGFVLSDFIAINHPGGVVIEGGQLNMLDTFKLFLSSAITAAVPGSSLLKFTAAAVDSGGWKMPYTTQVSNFTLGGGDAVSARRAENCLRIEAGDGLQFTNGYINMATDDLLRVQAVDGSHYLAGASFTNVYFDGMNMADGTPVGVAIPNDGVAGAYLYGLGFSRCVFGNFSDAAFKAREAGLVQLSITDSTFLNMAGWAADIEGTGAVTDLTISDCQFRSVGSTASTGVIRAHNGRNLKLTDNQYSICSGTGSYAVYLSAGWRTGIIADSTFDQCTNDYVNYATFAGSFSMSGNASNNVASPVVGLRPGNVAHESAVVLDWYEEGVNPTPELTFGGASTGVAYASRQIRWTRVGNTVKCRGFISISSKGSATGGAAVAGLPFTSHAANSSPGTLRLSGGVVGVGGNALCCTVGAGATTVTLRQADPATGGDVQLTDAAISNVGFFSFSVEYEV